MIPVILAASVIRKVCHAEWRLSTHSCRLRTSGLIDKIGRVKRKTVATYVLIGSVIAAVALFYAPLLYGFALFFGWLPSRPH